MKRVEAWPQLLAAYIEERRHAPFAWGVNDCGLFAADWVQLATGIDIALPFRGKYDSALSAAHLLREFGGIAASLEAVGQSCGMEMIDASRCSRGDLLVRNNGRGDAIGIQLGNCSAFVAREGLVFAPMAALDSARCWRI